MNIIKWWEELTVFGKLVIILFSITVLSGVSLVIFPPITTIVESNQEIHNNTGNQENFDNIEPITVSEFLAGSFSGDDAVSVEGNLFFTFGEGAFYLEENGLAFPVSTTNIENSPEFKTYFSHASWPIGMILESTVSGGNRVVVNGIVESRDDSNAVRPVIIAHDIQLVESGFAQPSFKKVDDSQISCSLHNSLVDYDFEVSEWNRDVGVSYTVLLNRTNFRMGVGVYDFVHANPQPGLFTVKGLFFCNSNNGSIIYATEFISKL
jgi:hypothetical protein